MSRTRPGLKPNVLGKHRLCFRTSKKPKLSMDYGPRPTKHIGFDSCLSCMFKVSDVALSQVIPIGHSTKAAVSADVEIVFAGNQMLAGSTQNRLYAIWLISSGPYSGSLDGEDQSLSDCTPTQSVLSTNGKWTHPVATNLPLRRGVRRIESVVAGKPQTGKTKYNWHKSMDFVTDPVLPGLPCASTRVI